MTARILDQDLPHEAGRDSKKMGAILPLRQFLTDQADVRFVNQGSALQGVVGAFALQVPMRHAAQFGVNDRHQGVEGFAITRRAIAPTIVSPGLKSCGAQPRPHAPWGWRELAAKHIPFCFGCQSIEKKWVRQVVSVDLQFWKCLQSYARAPFEWQL